MRLKTVALIAATLLSGPTVAYASPVTWTLNGTFSALTGGGTAGGSFDYDADTASFSNIALTTSTNRTYTQILDGTLTAELKFLQSGVTTGQTIALLLQDISRSMLTNAGGVLHVNTATNRSEFAEYRCTPLDTALDSCKDGFGGSVRNWALGGVSTLTGVPVAAVPEPGGLALLGLAVCGGLMTLRRRST